MPERNGRIVTTSIVTSLGALTTPADRDLLGGEADKYEFLFVANGGQLTLAGTSDLAVYSRARDEWTISAPNVGLQPAVLADGTSTRLRVNGSVNGNLVAIIMAGMVDAGTRVVKVTERMVIT